MKKDSVAAFRDGRHLLSKFDDVMLQHIHNLVETRHMSFCFLDFCSEKVRGEPYAMAHGTFRNKISKLIKAGIIEVECKSAPAFYTLKGVRFGRQQRIRAMTHMMTPNHMMVNSNSSRSDPIVKIIRNLPVDRNAVHDIRLRFRVKGIWEYLSTYHPELHINYDNKGILIPTWSIDGLLIRVTVHKTDNVSVLVACSLTPVAVDTNGVIRLSNALTRVEERLTTLLTSNDYGWNKRYHIVVDDAGKSEHNDLEIPGLRGWIVTMWHFGTDSLAEYSGKMFEVTWEIGQHALVRAYSKIMKDRKTRIRIERQEYPNKTFPEAIEEKLNTGGYRSL
jgi:hypothetical protein